MIVIVMIVIKESKKVIRRKKIGLACGQSDFFLFVLDFVEDTNQHEQKSGCFPS